MPPGKVQIPAAPPGSIFRLGRARVLVFGLAVLLEQAASAQTLEEAKAWFAEGNELEKGGDCDGAITAFEKALKVKETPQLHLRIGSCRERLGDFAHADDSYRRALELSAGNQSLVEAAETLRKQVEKKIAYLEVVNPKSAEVRVDGRLHTSAEAPLNPGKHHLSAELTGHVTFHQDLDLAAGEHRTFSLTMIPNGGVVGSAVVPPTDEGGAGPAPIILLALGIASVGGGVGLVVHSTMIESEIADLGCDLGDAGYTCETSAVSEEAQSLRDQGNIERGVGIGLMGLGAGLGVVSGVLWATAPASPVKPVVGWGTVGVAGTW